MDFVNVDFNHILGRMKPMHGICNGPLLGTDDKLFHYLSEAGIPYSRLHDTGGRFGGSRYVDVPNIFPDFDADPEDPAAYDFTFTDWLLSALHEQGTQPIYRLGVTIENSAYLKAYRIYPPADFKKWAQICAGIIRHYNEGWANGFTFNIQHWEIWNEPENEPDMMENPMWRGTKEQFFELYEVTSNYLKERFPTIKVGGYSCCGFYILSNTNMSETAKSSSRIEYFMEFFHDFMKHITSPGHESPLDFFSWHSYAGIEDNMTYAKYVRTTLNQYGFGDTSIILSEWNTGIQDRGKPDDCAKVAAMMCAMQNTEIDICTYYDGQVNTPYGGMFDPITEDIFKTYYAFKSFNVLYQLAQHVELETSLDCLQSCAASNGKSCAVLIANPNEEAAEFELTLTGLPTGKKNKIKFIATDKSNHFTQVDEMYCNNSKLIHKLKMKPYSIMLIRII